MPTVERIGPYRFFFYAGDSVEPPHIHVARDNKKAKFWLDPVRLQDSGRFSRVEISQVQALIEEHEHRFLRRWHEHFND